MRTLLHWVSLVLFAGVALPETWANVEPPARRVRVPTKPVPPAAAAVPDGGTLFMGGLPPIRIRPGG